jgi:hypothetical protein
VPYAPLQHEIDAVVAEAHSLVKETVAQSLNQADDIAKKAREEGKYDYEYALGLYNKLNAITDIRDRIESMKSTIGDYRIHPSKIQTEKNIEPKQGANAGARVYSIDTDTKQRTPHRIASNVVLLEDELAFVKKPDDPKYNAVDDIIRMRSRANGWTERAQQLEHAIKELTGKKYVQKSPYLSQVHTALEKFYRNGYLGEVAGMNDRNKKVIDSCINTIQEAAQALG